MNEDDKDSWQHNNEIPQAANRVFSGVGSRRCIDVRILDAKRLVDRQCVYLLRAVECDFGVFC
jgi:hypothetical protein